MLTVEKFSALHKWVAALVLHKNDTLELILRKKFFLITSFVAILFISFLTLLSYILVLKNFASYVMMLLAFTVAQTILLIIIRKWSRWFIYSVFSLYVILIFYIIISLGGIANSAGLLMAAYFFLLTSQWMEDTRLLIWIGVLYVVGVLITGISFPYLKVDESLSGWKNNMFFAINFGWIGLLLALALYYTIVKSENAAKSRAEQLQEFDLLKSRLYANIAHEFRTPLSLIRGNAEEICELHSGEPLKRAKSIIQNSDKILLLVNRMLNLSKIEEGKVPVHYIQSDMIVFIRHIVDSFQEYADLRKIKLHYKPLIPQLKMDIEAEKLEESMSNLLSNAIKYTPEGGDVYVTIEIMNSANNDKTDKETGQQVKISVRDTGIGIPEDELDKIFIRFYRVEDKRFPYQGGTGIGLTLVNEYLKLMNGSVHVNSTLGEGSEFVIVLPVTQNAKIENDVPIIGTYTHMDSPDVTLFDTIDSHSAQPRLLIIEDNKELTEYLFGILSNEYKILTTVNGIQGIEQATEHIPDIILSDVMMPGKDGYQVCKELKNDFRTNHIPIVLLTARADNESRICGMEYGADAYLTKPFDKKELMICLHNLFIQREKLRLKYQSHLYEKVPEEHVVGLNEKFLDKTIKILEKNYCNETFRIEELCHRLGISRVQLHRKLTALTGQSASNFIRSFRLNKARMLLLETEKNVSEIAYEVGFADPNYFTRVFIKELGMTPTDLRKSII